jgi:ComF family protein
MWMKRFDMLQLFYPCRCLLCGQTLLTAERYLCLHCLCDLPRTRYHKRLDNPMYKLYEGISQIREVSAFLFFEREGAAQTLIHAIKYHGNKSLAEQLGSLALREMKPYGLFEDMDCLIPVALHSQRERQRGYNQAEWIARGIASVCQRPVNCDALYRNISTVTQTHQSFYERHLNVEKIFGIRNPDALAGKHVLLIDDVITTGATSIACIEALLTVPDIRISVFALAIVPPQ